MRLHHVSIPAPGEAIEQERQFDGELTGIAAPPQPHRPEPSSALWFQAGDRELHRFQGSLADPIVSGRHFCAAVDTVADARQRLEHSVIRIESSSPVHNRPRFSCQDPFGSRLEIIEILAAYR